MLSPDEAIATSAAATTTAASLVIDVLTSLPLRLPDPPLAQNSAPVFLTLLCACPVYLCVLVDIPTESFGISNKTSTCGDQHKTNFLLRCADSHYVNATALLQAGTMDSESDCSMVLSLERSRIRVAAPPSPLSLAGTWIPLARARYLAETCSLDSRLRPFLDEDLPSYFTAAKAAESARYEAAIAADEAENSANTISNSKNTLITVSTTPSLFKTTSFMADCFFSESYKNDQSNAASSLEEPSSSVEKINETINSLNALPPSGQLLKFDSPHHNFSMNIESSILPVSNISTSRLYSTQAKKRNETSAPLAAAAAVAAGRGEKQNMPLTALMTPSFSAAEALPIAAIPQSLSTKTLSNSQSSLSDNAPCKSDTTTNNEISYSQDSSIHSPDSPMKNPCKRNHVNTLTDKEGFKTEIEKTTVGLINKSNTQCDILSQQKPQNYMHWINNFPHASLATFSPIPLPTRYMDCIQDDGELTANDDTVEEDSSEDSIDDDVKSESGILFNHIQPQYSSKNISTVDLLPSDEDIEVDPLATDSESEEEKYLLQLWSSRTVQMGGRSEMAACAYDYNGGPLKKSNPHNPIAVTLCNDKFANNSVIQRKTSISRPSSLKRMLNSCASSRIVPRKGSNNRNKKRNHPAHVKAAIAMAAAAATALENAITKSCSAENGDGDSEIDVQSYVLPGSPRSLPENEDLEVDILGDESLGHSIAQFISSNRKSSTAHSSFF